MRWSDRGAALAALALGSSAARAECPYTESAFREHVRASREAVAVDDLAAHRRVMVEVLEDLPCLDTQLPADPWAELLVFEALVRYDAGLEWQPLIRTARRIHPAVDVPDFVLADLDPETLAPTGPLPVGHTLFIDGRLATEGPQHGGLHVVQRLDGRTWTTWVMEGAELPASIAEGPAPADPSASEPGWASIWLHAGVDRSAQSVESPGTFLADGARTGLSLAVGSDGVWAPGSVGVGWTALVGLRNRGPTALGFGVGVVRPAPGVAVGLGAGIVTSQAVEGGEIRTGVHPQPRVELVLAPAGVPVDVELGGGALPGVWHGTGSAGWSLGGGDLTWRVGLLACVVGASWSEAGPDGRSVGTTDAFGGLQVGVVR